MLIEESLSPDMIEFRESVEGVNEVIDRMSEKLANRLDVEVETIRSSMFARERARTTAFTNGAAVPHCRLAELDRFGIAFMILRKPIRWDNEGHAVDTILMIAGPARNVSEHLRLLANSSQLLDSSAVRSKLKQAPDAQAAYDLMVAAEQAIEQRRTEEGMLRELRKDPSNGLDHLSEVVDRFNW